jgi:hypothetical protein
MKLSVERVRLDRGGYDSRGRYWGVGTPLYRVTSDEELPPGWYGSKYHSRYQGYIDEHVRASSARQAREKVASVYKIKATSRDPARTRRDSTRIGKRVQLHPATDRWMRGDRYGTVVRKGRKPGTYRVKMDRSGKTILVHERNIGEWM